MAIKRITLNEMIEELQKSAVLHGNDEIASIGTSSGKNGMFAFMNSNGEIVSCISILK